ncbi:MBL fold metallo-hydrolase [Streptomyces sp. NBC_01361]|uniref:MBL fold metallo-hydrolase n=1 Tax=Streptomyces sp. NBC_01361 TaxID=2903838 RepID=UPI002E332753|nr:MBL fold metallo-hydrolase [Streptomyces sp. NBC_01361]
MSVYGITEVIEVVPRLHLLRFPVGQAYLWDDGGELTLVDAGAAGAGTAIAGAVRALGHHPRDVRRIVLTHFHEDHAGGAGEFAALSGADVWAHPLDAPFVRGERPGPAPEFEEWERPLYAQAQKLLPPPPTNPVLPREVRELADGDVLDFGGGARVVAVPGHTDGSIALHLPHHGVLFTGDAVAASPLDGQVILGVLNLDRARSVESFRTLASLDSDVACFGHGDPVTGGSAAALRAAVTRLDAA